jgi:hypothetical protein
MSEPVRVVSCPDTEYRATQHEHLWLLVGGGDYFQGAQAFYLGQDRDIEGDDLASHQLGPAIEAAETEGLFVDRQDADEALADYRRSRSQRA